MTPFRNLEKQAKEQAIRAFYDSGMPVLKIAQRCDLSTQQVMEIVLAGRPTVEGGKGTGL